MSDATQPPLFLTEEETATLTGFKRHAKQAEWLRKNGIPFRLNARGRPIVVRSAVDGGAGRAGKEEAHKPWMADAWLEPSQKPKRPGK